jgi:hypothetical protein
MYIEALYSQDTFWVTRVPVGCGGGVDAEGTRVMDVSG